MSDIPSSQPGKRGRPGRRAETPVERIARLEKDLAAARRAAVEAEQRMLATIGAAVMAEANANPAFKAQLVPVLHARVTTKAGRASIASLLDQDAGISEPAAPVN